MVDLIPRFIIATAIQSNKSNDWKLNYPKHRHTLIADALVQKHFLHASFEFQRNSNGRKERFYLSCSIPCSIKCKGIGLRCFCKIIQPYSPIFILCNVQYLDPFILWENTQNGLTFHFEYQYFSNRQWHLIS